MSFKQAAREGEREGVEEEREGGRERVEEEREREKGGEWRREREEEKERERERERPKGELSLKPTHLVNLVLLSGLLPLS